MKKTNHFVLRKLGDETVLIPRGRMAEEINGVITLSDTAAFIYNMAAKAADFEELAMWLSNKYGVTPEESREDLRETLEQMKKNGMLEEANKEKLW